MEYCRVLEEIAELDDCGFTKYVLFEHDWFDVHNHNSGIMMDEYRFTFQHMTSFRIGALKGFLACPRCMDETRYKKLECNCE